MDEKYLSKRNIKLIDPIDEIKLGKKDGKNWYHGAPIDCILNIVENGIDLERGNKLQQFSRKNGFYVADNYQFSRDWAYEKALLSPKKQFGVLVFNFSVQDLKELTSEGLDIYDYGHNDVSEVVKQVVDYNENENDLDNAALQNAIKNLFTALY